MMMTRHYIEVVKQMVEWCNSNNLLQNVNKTIEIVVDFRKNCLCYYPLLIHNRAVETLDGTKFLGVHIRQFTHDYKHGKGNSAACVLSLQDEKITPSPPILTTVYRGTTESIMTNCISVTCSSCTAADWNSLQRVARIAEKMIGTSLLSVQDISNKLCLTQAKTIIRDCSHTNHELLSLLNSGWRYSVRSRTTRFCNSFIPLAIRLLN